VYLVSRGDVYRTYTALIVLTLEVAVDHIHFKNKMTPYEGAKLYGVVHETWLRGRKIWDIKNGGHQGPPSGLMMLDEREL